MSEVEVGALEARIREVGLALGLDAVGFARALPTARTRFLREWLDRGFGGEMHYLERRAEERIDPRRILPGARSWIVGVLALPAMEPARAPAEDSVAEAMSAADPGVKGGALAGPSHAIGRVARYAGGDDYHDVLLDRIRALEAALPILVAHPIESRSWVDTGPVPEKAVAEAAGLGWIAKNTCLIHPELGSHVMLGSILCDLELTVDPPVADHCGSCRACLDACPTAAFPEPYVLDATRCLSYTTIELRGPIPEPLRAAQGDRVFGCDECQTVCPWNRSRPRRPLADPLGLRARLAPRDAWRAPPLAWLLSLDEDRFAEATKATALRRTRRVGLLRNALVAAGNAADPALRSAVERHLESDEPILREHARWALARIEGVGSAD
ncbi:MAG: tRNA epoxyqueuosine(34) reductase QueG [Deltaproteobacteria bacterium]|nr:tRNA epoxyqueuosine(34) reductase QueG [Deltaproteobacteria bacterium]